ncbi:hypothetical protein NDU88_004905 [Pleurodeles waltl]|uniref:Saposin B-type domain-containing protein n=1 Tax=Pleurodeles waltl TaxID=8319 RepID=A0AAV7LW05_PLEWA|nr:hypothetical protein NDU88_004905 [Pleurodeles waltl]
MAVTLFLDPSTSPCGPGVIIPHILAKKAAGPQSALPPGAIGPASSRARGWPTSLHRPLVVGLFASRYHLRDAATGRSNPSVRARGSHYSRTQAHALEAAAGASDYDESHGRPAEHRLTVSDVEQVHLEISELCLQGPEYWCQSEQTASLCMKEDYCMELLRNAPAEALIGSGAGETAGSLKNPFGENKEWRRKDRFKKLRGGWGLKCKACKFVFKFLKNNVADDQSDGEIRSALDRVCQSVTFLLRFPCKWVIRKFKDAIIDAFEGHLDPATFCANVKMCSKQEETDMELSHLGDPKLCLQDSEYWCQSGETASLCMKEDYCMELWQNAPAELEASSHGGPEDATEEGKRKKNKKNKKGKQDKKGKKGKKNKRKEKTAVKCSGCTQIVTNLKNYVGGKLDDDTIKGAVDSMCDKVDDSIMKICTTIKEKNKDDLVAAVKNGGSPKDVCTQIQLCEGQELEESDGKAMGWGASCTSKVL